MFDTFNDAFRNLLNRSNNSKQSVKGRRPKPRQLRFENLERREMMTATPAAPVVTATAYSSSQINLSWNAVPGATGYIVDEWINGAWKQVANFNSSVHGSKTTGLSASTTYYFDVAAYNSAGTTFAHFNTVTTGIALDHPTAATSYTNVTGSLFGANGPSYKDVKQGAVGDCWLLASLAEVAARYPSDIKNMFTSAGTTVDKGVMVNLYNVRFFDKNGAARYVTVDSELPSGGNYYDHVSGGPLWVALAEKAYAQANGKGYVTTSHVGVDSYASLNGGNPAWALQAITGKSASSYSINPTNIASAWNSGKLIVMISSSSPSSTYIVGDSTSTHAYAMVGYNASSSQPFTVYNPWGADSSGWALGTFNGHKVFGQFTANASFISQNFGNYSVGAAADPDIQSSGNGLQNFVIVTDTHSVATTAGTQEHGQVDAPSMHEAAIIPTAVARPQKVLAHDSVFAAWGEDDKPAKLNLRSPSVPAFEFDWNSLRPAREAQLAFRA